MSETAFYGLIVEGPYDELFYAALIPRLGKADLHLATRVCHGVRNLMKQFPALLRDFEHVKQGQPVDKALVVRDSKGADTDTPLKQMENKIQARAYRFPRGVQLCVVRREMEAWLLADAGAVSAVARSRGGRQITEVNVALEEIKDPKAALKSLLSEARIEYTAPVCAAIASKIDLEVLGYRCPSFLTFKRKVLDC